MSNTRLRRHLFGGTLRHAGVIAVAALAPIAAAGFQPAAPPPFDPLTFSEPTQLHVFAYNTAGAEVDDLAYSYLAMFLPPQDYASTGIDLCAYAHATAMSASIAITDSTTWDAYAAVLTIQWFTVTSPSNAIFQWEFFGVSYGEALVYQLGIGGISPTATIGSEGSTLLTLLPGETYAFVGAIGVFGIKADAFAALQFVPAPGALAAFALGMTMRRRRRGRDHLPPLAAVHCPP